MPSVLELAVIANKIYDQDVTGIGPWSRADVSGSDTWGFYTGVFLHGNGRDVVIAFRGTDDGGRFEYFTRPIPKSGNSGEHYFENLAE